MFFHTCGCVSIEANTYGIHYYQSIKGARSYFEERSLERAPFENTGAEAGARSYFGGARTLERAPLFKCR